MSARSRRTFQELVTLPDPAIPLAEAALLMACEEYPQLEISPYVDQLDEIADAIRLRSAGIAHPDASPGAQPPSQPMDTVRAINEVLFDEFGFRGNSEDYYDPRNSFFNDVLDRRLGIPITLSIVYLEVCRRLNFPMFGVGMPGHFIVKYADRNQEIFLDPFHNGAVLSVEDCREWVNRHYRDSVQFSERLLARVTHRQIISRMLNNLKKIYIDSHTFDKGLGIVDMLLMVQPDDLEQYCDRGLLKIQLRQYEAAARDLEHYVKSAPNPEDRKRVADQLKELRQIQALMN
jgi:regulator of sirC expression with transglutaminase-like and TPR domain